MDIDIKKYGYGNNKYFIATIKDWWNTIETEDLDWRHLIETADTLARYKDNENQIAEYMIEKIKELFTKDEYCDFMKKYMPDEVFDEIESGMQSKMQDEMNYRMSRI